MKCKAGGTIWYIIWIFKFIKKEDATIDLLDYKPNLSIFGVFDGHGGIF